MRSDFADHVMRHTSLAGLDRERAKRSLRNFVADSWHEVEPARDYIPSWSTDAICDHLQACYEREIRNLIISVPPGSMKSLSCCVFFPAWVWSQCPSEKFIFGGAAETVILRDSRRNRRLIGSEWYQERWGDMFSVLPGGDTAYRFANDRGGFRQATTIQAAITGEHASIQVTDDPLKPLELGKSAHVAKTALDQVLTWWTETMATRLVDTPPPVRIIIMQRLHEGDLSGEMLKTGTYEHLCLPAEFEEKRKCYTCIGFEDPRTEEGELLNPERVPREALEATKAALGTDRARSAQLQQNPIPAGGNIIKEAWVQWYHGLPAKFTTMIQSWDCTFKDTDGSDYVCGQVWGYVAGKYYLVDQIWDRLSFSDTCKAVESMTSKWPKAKYKLIEDKANGPAVINALKRKISGLKAVNPEGGKLARVHAVEATWESGAVYFPADQKWAKDTLDEITGFPGKTHDDRVDAMSQALIFLEKKQISRLKEAMQNVGR